MEKNDDGSLIVGFRAGGTREMCWYLFIWGDETPDSLRLETAEMCSRLAVHHQVRPDPARSHLRLRLPSVYHCAQREARPRPPPEAGRRDKEW